MHIGPTSTAKTNGNGGNGNGAKALLKWWPIIFAMITWGVIGFGGFFTLRTEVLQSRTERIGQVNELKIEIAQHEAAQADAVEEQNRRLSVIEADIKELLRRGK